MIKIITAAIAATLLWASPSYAQEKPALEEQTCVEPAFDSEQEIGICSPYFLRAGIETVPGKHGGITELITSVRLTSNTGKIEDYLVAGTCYQESKKVYSDCREPGLYGGYNLFHLIFFADNFAKENSESIDRCVFRFIPKPKSFESNKPCETASELVPPLEIALTPELIEKYRWRQSYYEHWECQGCRNYWGEK